MVSFIYRKYYSRNKKGFWSKMPIFDTFEVNFDYFLPIFWNWIATFDSRLLTIFCHFPPLYFIQFFLWSRRCMFIAFTSFRNRPSRIILNMSHLLWRHIIWHHEIIVTMLKFPKFCKSQNPKVWTNKYGASYEDITLFLKKEAR